jgi:hypothetical protein
MIQETKIDPWNEGTVVHTSKEFQDTEVIKQGVGVWSVFWNRDGILIADYLQKGATNSVK